MKSKRERLSSGAQSGSALRGGSADGLSVVDETAGPSHANRAASDTSTKRSEMREKAGSGMKIKAIANDGRLWLALAILLLVNCLLLAPLWIRSGGIRPHWVALEAVLVVALFLLLPKRRWVWVPASVVAVATVASAVLLLVDSSLRMSLARPLNLYLDTQLLPSVHNLLTGAFGKVLGTTVLVLAPMVIGLLTLALAAGLVGLGQPRAGFAPRVRATLLLVVALAAIPTRWMHPTGVVLALPTAQLAKEQATMLAHMLDERDRFRGEMLAVRNSEGEFPLDRLGGRDVVLAFIESYGMTALDDPRYRPIVMPAIERLAEVAKARGLHVVSAQVEAPSQGGMSWLGHGTTLSGLWLDNQLRYDLLLAADQPTLIEDFEAVGYSSVALMPQITMAWPEGWAIGYDRIWTRPNIDYRGPPLNWVEVPDQFTWAWLQREALSDSLDAPVFAEVGFISSHAPWTPILELEPWDRVGDGSIFERWRNAGERPEDMWLDTERVRVAFAQSMHYALSAMVAWVETYLDEHVVLIVLGDHQPAPLVTGDEAPRTVPVHIITANADDAAAFVALGFVPGVTPPPVANGSAPRMTELRGWIRSAFSSGVSRVVTE